MRIAVKKVLDSGNGCAQDFTVNTDKKQFPVSSKSQVLVVDDDVTIRGLLSATLVARGYEVCVAPRGEDVRAFYQVIQPQVVLLDWLLPDGDGLQLLPEIKHHWPAAEVIMMTGYGGEAIARRAAQLGAFRFLKKPFSLDDLALAVQAACQRHSEARPAP